MTRCGSQYTRLGVLEDENSPPGPCGEGGMSIPIRTSQTDSWAMDSLQEETHLVSKGPTNVKDRASEIQMLQAGALGW